MTIYVKDVESDPPVAEDDAETTDEDTPVNIKVLDNDSPAPLTVTGVDSDNGPSNGKVTLKPDGSFDFTPDPNFNGVDSFVYHISDGNGGMDAALGAC